MATYFELEVWASSRKLAVFIYSIVKNTARHAEDLADGLRNCAVSIPTIVAHGCSASRLEDRNSCFREAKRLLQELELMLQEAKTVLSIEDGAYSEGLQLIRECSKHATSFQQQHSASKIIVTKNNRNYISG